MPQEEEASTQNSIDEGGGGGFDSKKPEHLTESWVCHQAISDRTLGFGVRQMKGEEIKLKGSAKQEIEGKQEQPSGSTSEQWMRVPSVDSVSFLKNFGPATHGSSFERYHVFLVSGIWTVLLTKSQVKP